MPDEPSAAPARPRRTHLYLAAELTGPASRGPVRVRNLSPEGAMIEGAGELPVGAPVLLERGGLAVSAVVRWADERRLGLLFDGPVNVDAWMAPLKAGHQQGVDRAIAAVRSPTPALPIARPQLSPAATMADDLVLAGQLVEKLSDVLADDAGMIERHSERLQMLDLLAQLLGTMRQRSTGNAVVTDSLRASIRAALRIADDA